MSLVISSVYAPFRMAERVGFEPTLEFPLNTLSKRAPSTTRPPHHARSRGGPHGGRRVIYEAGLTGQAALGGGLGETAGIEQRGWFAARQRPLQAGGIHQPGSDGGGGFGAAFAERRLGLGQPGVGGAQGGALRSETGVGE